MQHCICQSSIRVVFNVASQRSVRHCMVGMHYQSSRFIHVVVLIQCDTSCKLAEFRQWQLGLAWLEKPSECSQELLVKSEQAKMVETQVPAMYLKMTNNTVQKLGDSFNDGTFQLLLTQLHIPYSGKFLRGRSFRNFHDQTPARENLFPRKFLPPKISHWWAEDAEHSVFEPQIQ